MALTLLLGAGGLPFAVDPFGQKDFQQQLVGHAPLVGEDFQILDHGSGQADGDRLQGRFQIRQRDAPLAQLGRQYGYEQIGRGRLTNDALIAMSAARCGYTILTLNTRDFFRLAEFRPFRYELATGFAVS